ncbi:MAG: type IIL restriction-modification enzyme MmeI, partial [Acidobacteriaceae bacterium]
FHWEIEFPEAFERDNAGFDVIIGNPPFMGGKRISGSLGDGYAKWLTTVHAGASGNTDLVAHFYRRAFELLRDGGAFGLIATKTVAQGDTRRGGLAWLGMHGGEIINARRRVKWPGTAAVIVSVVVMTRGDTGVMRFIDNKPVDFISAFLSHRGTHEDPARLVSNLNRSYIGCDIKGQGFLFADDDQEATPISVMQRLIAADPRNSQCLRPYIGGEELNTSPTQSHHRWVIHFGEMDEAQAREWPELLRIVEEKVKPERATKSKDLAEWPWWRFWRVRGELENACRGLDEVLAVAQTADVLAFTFVRLPMTFSHTVVVFPSRARAFFAVLQSRIHESWARFFAATMKDDARYIPKDCFETFPFPDNWEANPVLKAAGTTYHEFRTVLMVQNNEGLTKTYNRFHDPDERDPDILKLRELHAAMDRAVLDAYAWSDIKTDCDFILDYEIDEEEWGDKKKPWRYRWPDDVRDEVLARLLELNGKRAKGEARSGAAAVKNEAKKPRAKRAVAVSDTKELFS